MANAISVTIRANASEAAATLSRVEKQVQTLGTTARIAGLSIDKAGNSIIRLRATSTDAAQALLQGARAADRFGKESARAAQEAARAHQRFRQELVRTRDEQEKLAARNRRGGLGGLGGYIAGGIAAGVTNYALGALSSGVSTGFNQLLEESRSAGLLGFTAGRTGYSAAGQFASADALRSQFGLTRAQSFALQAQTLRFTNTIGQGQNAGRLGGALANALAASGRSTSEIPIRLQQLQTGQDELFDVLGPVKIGSTYAGSPEQIYKAYAREILGVKRELTDLEKQQARYYAVLQAGDAAHGAAEARLKSLAGSYELLSNRVTDLLSKLAGGTFDTPTGRGALGGAARAVEDFSTLLGSNDPNSQRSILNLSPVASVANQYGRLTGARNAGRLGAYALAIARDPLSILTGGGVSVPGAAGGGGSFDPFDLAGGLYTAGRSLVGRGFAGLQQIAAEGAAVERSRALDYRLGLLRQRGTDPFNDIGLRFYDEKQRIGEQLASGRITNLEATAARRYARGERDLAISERRDDLTAGLQQQLQGFRARFTGAANPIAQIASEGRAEFQRLSRDLDKLKTYFPSEVRNTLIAQQQGAAFNLGVAGANNISAAANIEGRIAQLQGRTSVTGYRRGRYGQLTNEPIFGTAYGESARDQIDRVFRTSPQIRSFLGAGLAGTFDPDQASAITGRLERQYLLSSLGQFRPEEFTADQRRRYQEILQQAREDEIRQAAEALVEMRTIANTIKRIDSRLAGEEPLEISTNVNLEDRAEGADFRFKNRLFQTGDTLSNQF
jgi:hypothetical protein